MIKLDVKASSDRELVLSCLLDASPEKVYRAWTEAELMKKWFAPLPWTVSRAEVDVRPGGKSLVVMKSPEGQEFPGAGLYLEVVPNKKLVFTDAFTEAWQPSEKAFMVVTITLENESGKTRYTARAQHWSVESRKEHEKMGFHEGWSQCAAQLEKVAASL